MTNVDIADHIITCGQTNVIFCFKCGYAETPLQLLMTSLQTLHFWWAEHSWTACFVDWYFNNGWMWVCTVTLGTGVLLWSIWSTVTTKSPTKNWVLFKKSLTTVGIFPINTHYLWVCVIPLKFLNIFNKVRLKRSDRNEYVCVHNMLKLAFYFFSTYM